MPNLHTLRVSVSRPMDIDMAHTPVEVRISVKKTKNNKTTMS